MLWMLSGHPENNENEVSNPEIIFQKTSAMSSTSKIQRIICIFSMSVTRVNTLPDLKFLRPCHGGLCIYHSGCVGGTNAM